MGTRFDSGREVAFGWGWLGVERFFLLVRLCCFVLFVLLLVFVFFCCYLTLALFWGELVALLFLWVNFGPEILST